MNEEFNKISQLPIYQKAVEILKVVKEITDLIPHNDKMLQMIKDQMLSDAFTLAPKIVNAETCQLYDLKMENAAIIRKAARELSLQIHSLAAFEFEQVEYYQIVRDLVEEFRLLFIEWVATFDPKKYLVDRWGLFNPPGVGPYDEDPDIDFDDGDLDFDDDDLFN